LTGPALGEHFFRHEYGRLVAMLVRGVGVRHLEAIEDATQSALLAAIETWTRGGLPENPSAWLFRVASNHVIGDLRQAARRNRLTEEHSAEVAHSTDIAPSAFMAGDVRDDLLRMLFACCDESIPVESQLVVALKTLCGFDVREIAERLFLTEANVYKRLGRARSQLRDLPFDPNDLSVEQVIGRLPAVQSVLYLLFTEGYLSSHAESAIRRDLCDEAKRLTGLLTEQSVTATPETFALLALMHLHSARMTARQDEAGDLLLLDEQDRTLWDQEEIRTGLSWLARSADGPTFSRYHAEAGIAAEHCLAPSISETRWDRIVECYALLERLAPSAIHTLNRAVAVAEWRGPLAGLAVIEGLEPPSWLAGSYLWAAVLSDLHRRCGHDADARRYAHVALETAPSSAIKETLQRRLQGGVA